MTIELLAERPKLPAVGAPILAVENLTVAYGEGGRYQPVVHGVSFTVEAGEVVALVGESGSGKTSTAQAIIGLLPENGRIAGGAIRLNGTDIAGWPQKRLDAIRGARISLVPQDPGSSLNPVTTIGAQVGEILRIHGWRDRQAIDRRVIELLAKVGLSDPGLRATQYPHELSGGMKQRVLIAISIALEPSLIIADEPTSALDVTVQKRILDLIDELRREFGTAVLLVTHDLGVAADRATRLLVLQNGPHPGRGPDCAGVGGTAKRLYAAAARRRTLAGARRLPACTTGRGRRAGRGRRGPGPGLFARPGQSPATSGRWNLVPRCSRHDARLGG